MAVERPTCPAPRYTMTVSRRIDIKDLAMISPIRILLQTTIQTTADDWHIGRFSMLRDHLAGLVDGNGAPLCAVTARDRTAPGGPDPLLSTIDQTDFDEL